MHLILAINPDPREMGVQELAVELVIAVGAHTFRRRRFGEVAFVARNTRRELTLRAFHRFANGSRVLLATHGTRLDCSASFTSFRFLHFKEYE